MQIAIIILLVIFLLILWAMIEQKLLVTTRYTVKSDKLPKALDHTCFVVLADLHNMNFGKNNKRVVKRIDRLSPEFILVAGDLIDKNAPSCPSNAFNLMDQLAGKYKIFYAYGNHEQRVEVYSGEDQPQEKKKLHASWTLFKGKLKNKKVEFLDNTSTFWMKGQTKLKITGVSIDHKYFEHWTEPVMEDEYLRTLIGRSDKDNFQILIAHNPVYFTYYADWGADLIISGHLHGGLVRLPGIGGVVSPQVKLFPKYHSGNFTENGQEMIVSRGLGTHSHMPRLFNVPEIVCVELINK